MKRCTACELTENSLIRRSNGEIERVSALVRCSQRNSAPFSRLHDRSGEVGRYELLERIEQGTLGVLYRAHDTVLRREVAVKVMAAGFLGDEKAHARFFHEAKAAAPPARRIVRCSSSANSRTRPVVMEFLRGFSLAERMRQSTAMPLGKKSTLPFSSARGLEAAHKQGVIHRDVKRQTSGCA